MDKFIDYYCDDHDVSTILFEEGAYDALRKDHHLLEYIVHRDTNNPLLIDHPEDNVDNQTIYGKIKNWFYTLKQTRQVIVVTHDANIIINAAADNVILTGQESAGHLRCAGTYFQEEGACPQART